MLKTCGCCGKEITNFSFGIKGGYLCGECYEKTSKYCDGLLSQCDIKLFTVKEIKDIINVSDDATETYSIILLSTNGNDLDVIRVIRKLNGCDLSHAKAIIDNVPSKICKNLTKNRAEIIKKSFNEIGASVEIRIKENYVTKSNEQKDIAKKEVNSVEANPKDTKSEISARKAIYSIVEILLFILFFTNSNFQNKVTNFFVNIISEFGGEAYIDMVKDVEFMEGLTYGEWLDGNDYFESKEWKYSWNGGNKFVQFNGIGNGDVLQIKFALECVNENEGTYLITPQQISVNGVPITDILSLISMFVN